MLTAFYLYLCKSRPSRQSTDGVLLITRFYISLQEDGWATGVILMTGVKGIFPENFTKKLE